METEQTLTNTIYSKMLYIIIICPCLLLIAYSRGKLSALLNSVPHDDLINFAVTYMTSDSHQLLLILTLILLVIVTMATSTYFLVKKFGYDEKQGKILNIILITVNISVIIITILSNLITFKIILGMVLVTFVVLFAFSGIGSDKND